MPSKFSFFICYLQFLFLFACSPTSEQQKSPKQEPTTKPQIESTLTSGLTLERFDRTVRPQDDFYQFVNGTWLKTFKLPADKSRYGVFNDLHEQQRTIKR